MKILYVFLCVLFLLPLQGTAQEARVSKKEARMIERGLKRKEKKTSKFRELNEFGIDIYATSVIQAIRRHIGTAKLEGNKAIVMRDRIGSFTDGEPPYALWDVDGNLIGKTPPTWIRLNVY